MDERTLVVGAHATVGVGLGTFGLYRLSVGGVGPGLLTLGMAAVIVLVGFYVADLA